MWTLAAGPSGPSGAATRQLTQARSRRFTWRLDGPADCQFTIDARSDEAAVIESLASDIWAWRDGSLMFRGRVGTESDTISGNVHTTVFSVLGYRGMLGHRRVVDGSGNQGVTFSSTSQATICWNLIDWTQSLSGGDWGITDGIGNTSATNRDRTIEPGATVGEQIGLIGRLDNGFEWEIDAELAFNRWYPTRGSATGVVLDYGGLVVEAQRQLNPEDFANSVLVTGSEGLTNVTADSAGIGSDDRGRWEITESFPSILEQGTLTDRGPQLLATTEILRPEWSVTLKQGVWQGQSHIWIGDTVIFAVNSGRLNFAENYRVAELSVDVGESGEETVTLGLLAET